MANGRGGRKKVDSGRDPGGFVALPWSVLDCAAYMGLSHPARSLHLELARQLSNDNNGRLLLSAKYLSKRGWKSADVITRAKRELLAAGLIFETVMGHRPNRASWYAVTWRALDKLPGFDPGAAAAFDRSAYAKARPAENAKLRPAHGAAHDAIAPRDGAEHGPPAPSGGAIGHAFVASSTPPSGNHLEEPSAVEVQ